VHVLALLELAEIAKLTDELRRLVKLLIDALRALVAGVVLQQVDVLQTVRVLRRLLDGGALHYRQNSPGLGHPTGVAHAAHVLPGVVAHDAQQIQGNESELEDGCGAGTCE